jgi:prevent-host-death family protein
MKIASVADVKANLSAYIKASADELVVITKNGKPVAVLLPMEDDDELERLALAYSRRFQAILHEAREQIRSTGGIPHDDFWREVEAETTHKRPAQDNAAKIQTRMQDTGGFLTLELFPDHSGWGLILKDNCGDACIQLVRTKDDGQQWQTVALPVTDKR